jgi:hypothetical protein
LAAGWLGGVPSDMGKLSLWLNRKDVLLKQYSAVIEAES